MVATKASLSKEAAEGNMHAKMAFFISSCLFFLSNSLRLLLGFINMNALRYQIYVERHNKKYEEEYENQNRFLFGNDTSGFKDVQRKAEEPESKNQLFGEEKITTFCSHGNSDDEGLVRLISELSGLDSVTQSSTSDGCSVQEFIIDPEIRQTSNDDSKEEEEEAYFEVQMNKEAVSNETSPTVLHCSVGDSFVAGKQVEINCIGREESELGKGTSQESNTWVREEDELDEIWEHQDLIEQLLMELKKVRAIGLPTILEEPESPTNVDQPTPPDKHEKLVPEEHPMDELHKLHECYREKMRKLDVLNYQKLYASGFLQLEDPLKTRRPRRHMLSAMVSHLPQAPLILYEES
ncbi:hypothetical protein HPP92_016800 [Vanilla planifolia]|uniref:Uncharacterized protein n=1 Tax=Vanilla planifolia TaxID=51239 RepID=A0A835QGE7_VANPL|nr:hypothetical protein HPP92_016800 [Vanilla planifolia]